MGYEQQDLIIHAVQMPKLFGTRKKMLEKSELLLEFIQETKSGILLIIFLFHINFANKIVNNIMYIFFSINYGWKQISMKNLKMRQNFLLANWGFQCSCRLCQYEKSNHPDEEKYENFAKLQQQSKKLLEVAKTAGQVRLAIIKKEVTCYKEMYKLAEQKNCSKVNTNTVLKKSQKHLNS